MSNLSLEDELRILTDAAGFPPVRLYDQKPRFYQLKGHGLTLNWWFESKKQTVTIAHKGRIKKTKAADAQIFVALAIEARAKIRSTDKATQKPVAPVRTLAEARKSIATLEPLPPDAPIERTEAILKLGANRLGAERWRAIRERAYRQGFGEIYQLVRYIELMKVEPK